MSDELMTEEMLNMSQEEMREHIKANLGVNDTQMLTDIFNKAQGDIHAALDRNYDLYCMVLGHEPDEYKALLGNSATRASYAISQLLRVAYAIKRASRVSDVEFERYVALFFRLDEENFELMLKAHGKYAEEKFKDREKTTEPELENAERPFVVASGLNIFKYTTCVGCGKPPTEITRNPNCMGPNFQFSTFEYADKHVRSGLCEDCLKWAEENMPEVVK